MLFTDFLLSCNIIFYYRHILQTLLLNFYRQFNPKVFNIFASTLTCTKTCINPCEDFLTVEATLTTTQQNVPMSDEIMLVAQKMVASGNYGWNDDYIKEAFHSSVMAKIYFASTEITVVETSETIDIMTFIGNVGGMLGR